MKVDQFLRSELPEQTTSTKVISKLEEYELRYCSIPESIKQVIPSEEVEFNLEDFLLVLKKVMAKHKVYAPTKIPIQADPIDDIGQISVLQSSFDILSQSNQSLIIEKDVLQQENGTLEDQLVIYKQREQENIKEMEKLMDRLQYISHAQHGITGELEDYKQVEKTWLIDIGEKEKELKKFQTLVFDHQQVIKDLEMENKEYLEHINQLQNSIATLEKLKFEKEVLTNDNSKLQDEIVDLKSQYIQHPFTSELLMDYNDFKQLSHTNDISLQNAKQLISLVHTGILKDQNDYDNKINQMNTVLHEKQVENDSLTKLLDNMKNELDMLQIAMDSKITELTDLKTHSTLQKSTEIDLNNQIQLLQNKLKSTTDKLNKNNKLQKTDYDLLDKQVDQLLNKKQAMEKEIKLKTVELQQIATPALGTATTTASTTSTSAIKLLKWSIGATIMLLPLFYLIHSDIDDKTHAWIAYHLSKLSSDKVFIL